MQWMTNYRNPCQKVWYHSLYEKDLQLGNQSACPEVPSAEKIQPISCLPYVYQAGVTKSGTSNLYHALLRHPKIHASKNEVDFWTKRVLGIIMNILLFITISVGLLKLKVEYV